LETAINCLQNRRNICYYHWIQSGSGWKLGQW